MVLIGPCDKFKDQQMVELVLEGTSLLLIYNKNKHYLIQNECGHFGIPLTRATIVDNTIVCNGHGISFDLDSGNIVNRPYENCDPITVHELIIVDKQLYWNN